MTTTIPCKPHRLVAALATILATPAYAANFEVTTPTDDGTGGVAGTLSKAILDANTSPGDDTISLTTDVTLAGVMKRLIDSNVTLQSDATPRTISGNDLYRPLFVKSGTVTIRNLTLSNGLAKGGNSDFGGGGAGLGGALFVYDGTVTVENVTFSTNNATGGGRYGAYFRGGGGMVGSGSNGGGGGGLFAP
ncbi:MAG: hypothetical protein WAW42_12910, partial [Candidatus Competibacteraceae bacterium]